MGRGRGGASRGGGRGGRGGKRGGGDAASSGDLNEGAPVSTKRGRGGKKTAAAAEPQFASDVSASMKRAQRHEDMYDEVDDFMDNRHRIALSRDGDDDDSEEEADDRQYGQSFELEGLEPEDDEDEDDEDGPQGYDEVEAAEEAAARERELAAEANISKGWGRKKGTYYEADTVDFELESDEDIAADEEKEGKRLQREQMEQIEGDVDELDDMLAMVAAEDDQNKSEKDAAAGKKKGAKKGDSTDAELLKAMDDDLDNIQMVLDMDMEMDLGDDKEEKKSKKKASSQR